MRTAAIFFVFLCSGCLITSQTTRRVALAAIPSAPAGLSGSPGVSVTGRFLAGTPESTGAGGAMAFPMFQPELGAVLRIDERSYVGGKFAIASAEFGAVSPPGIIEAPRTSAGFDVGIGGGHDFGLTSIFGVSLSGEIGLSGVDLTTRAGTFTDTHLVVFPAIRIALGVYAEPGAFRFYGGGTVGTSAINDATGVRTADCTATPCTISETGAVNVSAVAMLGGGVRWQGNPFISVAMEGWVPLTETGVRVPFTFSFTLRLGDLVVKPRVRPPPPPPPAPELTPDSELPLPQI